jgi:hypothetical protein
LLPGERLPAEAIDARTRKEVADSRARMAIANGQNDEQLQVQGVAYGVRSKIITEIIRSIKEYLADTP